MAENRKDSLIRRAVRRRGLIQGAFLLLWLDPLAIRMHAVCGPVFHCYSCPLATFACPIGVVANFSALHLFPFIAAGTLVITGAVFGTLVCGWACPFGFLQDLLGKVPVRKVRLPDWLGYGRYVVLIAFVLAIPYLFSEDHPLFFCRLCPAGALEGAVPNMARAAAAGGPIPWPSPLKLAILGLVVVAAFVKWRPWCSLFCPLGAFFGLCNRVSMVALRFHGGRCTGCGGCDRMCRYGVLPDRRVNNTRCIRCLECTRCQSITLGTIFDRPRADENGRSGPACPPVGSPGVRPEAGAAAS